MKDGNFGALQLFRISGLTGALSLSGCRSTNLDHLRVVVAGLLYVERRSRFLTVLAQTPQLLGLADPFFLPSPSTAWSSSAISPPLMTTW